MIFEQIRKRHGGRPMATDAEYPAIARAAQRFFKRAGRGGPGDLNTEPAASVIHVQKRQRSIESSAQYRSCLQEWTRVLDADLSLVEHDVDKVHSAVSRANEEASESVDEFIASLGKGGYVTEQIQQPRAVTVKLVSRTRRRPPRVTVDPSRGTATVVSSRKEATTRAARLAIEAVKATVIQRAVLWFIYHRLYPGGKSQLRAARDLRRVTERRKWLRRWQHAVRMCRRVRRRLMRWLDKGYEAMVERCHLASSSVRESDGNYGQAKVFHRLRLCGAVLYAWMDCVSHRLHRQSTIQEEVME